MLVSYFYICHSSSLHNPGHELKNESCMVISNLLSYLGFCHFPPHLSKTSDYWIFFNFIFNFKILSLLLKDLINPFLSKLHWQISSTLFCFFFVFLLPYPFFLLFVWFSLISCYFLNNFLLCENEKHFLLCSISHPLYCGNFHCSYCFIVGIESRVGFCKLEYKVLAIIWHKITWKYTNNSSKYTYTTV